MKPKKPALPAVPSRSEILERDPVHEIAKISFRDYRGAPIRPEVTTREVVSAGILLRLNSYLAHLQIVDPETNEAILSADPLEQLAVLQLHPKVPPVIRVQAAKELARIIYPNGMTADAGTVAANVLDAAAAPEEKTAYVGPKRKRGRPRKSPATVLAAPRAIVPATPVEQPDDIEDEAPILEREPELQPSLETPLNPPKPFDLEIEPERPVDPRIQPGWRTEDPLVKQRMLADYLRSVQ